MSGRMDSTVAAPPTSATPVVADRLVRALAAHGTLLSSALLLYRFITR